MQKVADSSAGFTGYVWTKAVSGKKTLRIQKYPHTYVRMGPNGHREKDNYHSYSLWINSYGTSLNGRYFFRLESNVHSLRHE